MQTQVVKDVYSNEPAMTQQPQPTRKHAKGNLFLKPDPMLAIDQRIDTDSLVSENERLHLMQQYLKRKKLFGLL